MKITETPQKPFDVVIIDLIGPLPLSNNGNEYALTMICDMTKYLVTSAIPDKSAKTVAKAIFDDFILKYSIMKEIRTDCGTEFKNKLTEELCNLLKISHSFSTPHRHETVGTIERNHSFFNQYIRAYVSQVSDWDEYLKYFTFCYNCTTSSSFEDRFTPFELVFCRKPNLPYDLLNRVDPLYNIDNFVLEAKFRLQTAHGIAKTLLNKLKMRNKQVYDRQIRDLELSIGDKVYLVNEPYHKLKPVHSGPYIIKNINEQNVEIFDTNTNKSKIVHANRLRM